MSLNSLILHTHQNVQKIKVYESCSMLLEIGKEFSFQTCSNEYHWISFLKSALDGSLFLRLTHTIICFLTAYFPPEAY